MKTNTPNPLVPQGTFSDPKAKSNLRMTVFLIIAGHLVLISGLLMAGCKKTAEPSPDDSSLFSNTFDSTNTDTSSLSTSLPPVITTGSNSTFTPFVEPSNSTPVQVVTSNPPPETTTPVVPEGGVREHTIVAKDSFYTLAKQYNVTTKAIQDANPGVDSKRLKIGQRVKIPAPTAAKAPTTSTVSSASGDQKVYVVKSGDRLSTIATREHTTVNAIKSANGLRTDRITVGQKLKIPVKAAAAPKAAAATTTAPVTTAPVTTAPLTESVTGFPPITPASAPTTPTVTP